MSVQKGLSTLRLQLEPETFPFPVLGFWGKITMPNAGTMAYRRDYQDYRSLPGPRALSEEQ